MLTIRAVSAPTPTASICGSMPADAGESLEIGAAATRRLLLVDDDSDLRQLIANYLRRNGFAVIEAENATSMAVALARDDIDIIVLDVMMPGEDGLSILRRLRDRIAVPILILSALGEDTDRIVGIEVGADDYLAKPCNPRELLARLRALLRRHDRLAGGSGIIRFGAWALDCTRREVARDDMPPTPLTDAEFRLLMALCDQPMRVLSRDQLLESSHAVDSDVFDRAVDVTISRLRRKLGGDNPIRTVRGEGYMLDARVAVR